MTRQEQKVKEMIDNIMDNFEWDKCVKAMKALNWTWALVPGYPQESDLKKTAKYLIESAIKGALSSKLLRNDEPYFSSTGGLKASVSKNKHNHINWINLEFILSEWSDDGD